MPLFSPEVPEPFSLLPHPAFPETFFVDKNGNIVGETYSGSHSLDEWKEIVEKELENVTEGK